MKRRGAAFPYTRTEFSTRHGLVAVRAGWKDGQAEEMGCVHRAASFDGADKVPQRLGSFAVVAVVEYVGKGGVPSALRSEAVAFLHGLGVATLRASRVSAAQQRGNQRRLDILSI